MAWAMGSQGDDSRNIYKSVKVTTPCPCCSQAHPIYRCELFKGKTPGERFELAKRKNLCYTCLKSNQIKQLGRTMKHTARSCPSKFKCKIEGCGALHHTLLHKPESLKETAEEKDKNIELPTVTSSTATSKATHAVLLRVIPVRVIGERQVATTYAMLDSGSEITLVDQSLVKQVGAQGHLDKLVVSTVSKENDVQHGYCINLSVESLINENSKRLKLTNAWSSKELKIPLRHQGVFQDKSRWPHLQNVPSLMSRERRFPLSLERTCLKHLSRSMVATTGQTLQWPYDPAWVTQSLVEWVKKLELSVLQPLHPRFITYVSPAILPLTINWSHFGNWSPSEPLVITRRPCQSKINKRCK
ncbi:Hypothetical predicted protein [Paramuricea clavata]|uniref:Uncharacterized protein n=1 Tax=Paramuricea clavata TaxID=317549 RepID=A0A7D9EG43_PARCT|nr:Hypothetical predicted protein [Paramuricea clavata]